MRASGRDDSASEFSHIYTLLLADTPRALEPHTVAVAQNITLLFQPRSPHPVHRACGHGPGEQRRNRWRPQRMRCQTRLWGC